MRTFAICGLLLVGLFSYPDPAAAGEKFVLRGTLYRTKAETLEVGDPEGHRVGVSDWIGVVFNSAGSGFLDTAQYIVKGTSGGNKAAPTAGGYKIFAQRDGSKAFARFETIRILDDGAEGTFQFMGGTDKLAGIKGGGKWRVSVVAPGLLWDSLEGEFELAR
jgi:hypothetical protein